jgi:antitoxin component YwqK of YwqJK toxin-antitoxin module
MKYIILFISTALLLGSIGCKDSRYERREIGNDIVEAKFTKDSLINGLAKFYDHNGQLESQGYYVKGKKTGPFIILVTIYQNTKKINLICT